jgi:hypothetical protein
MSKQARAAEEMSCALLPCMYVCMYACMHVCHRENGLLFHMYLCIHKSKHSTHSCLLWRSCSFLQIIHFSHVRVHSYDFAKKNSIHSAHYFSICTYTYVHIYSIHTHTHTHTHTHAHIVKIADRSGTKDLMNLF